MDTNNTTESPESSLSSALAGVSGLENPSSSNSTENTTPSESQADRGTPETENQATVATEGKPTEASKDNASTLDATQKQNVKAPRSEQRKLQLSEQLSSLANQVNKAKAELAELNKQKAEAAGKTPAQAVQEENLIPPPAKPKYDRKQLKTALYKAEDAGDVELTRAIREEMENVDQYERDYAKWESQNGKALSDHQSAVNYYRAEIAEKWPELTDPASPASQVFSKIIKSVPEILKRKDGELIAAQVTNMQMRASKVDALEKENTELKEKLQSLEKKIQPAKQTTATKLSQNTGEDLDSNLTSKLVASGRFR